jgi:hypothetical protein
LTAPSEGACNPRGAHRGQHKQCKDNHLSDIVKRFQLNSIRLGVASLLISSVLLTALSILSFPSNTKLKSSMNSEPSTVLILSDFDVRKALPMNLAIDVNEQGFGVLNLYNLF